MNKLTRIILVGVLAALTIALSVPVMAQEVPGPGEGGAIVYQNFGADPATFNAVLSSDGTSAAVIARIFPSFLPVNPDIGFYAPASEGGVDGIAASWTISEDGLVYTFTLRDDYTWTDGTPVTADDVVYAWNAIANDSVATSLTYIRDVIATVEAADPQTVVITLTAPACNALNNISVIPVLPSHIWSGLIGEDYALMNDSEENLNPTVTSGPFSFLNFRPGEQVTLLADQNYPEGLQGYVVPEGLIFKNVPDQTVGLEQFLANEITYLGVPEARKAEFFERVQAGEFQGYVSAFGNMRFVGLNTADPANPQSALDEEGNPIDQGIHPIFGDVRVRQALNYAIQFEEINQGAFGGFGVQASTHSLGNSWAHPQDLAPYPFDQDQANALLEEAGWVDTDGDGVRNCQGCLYATEVDPTFEGSPLTFKLETNAGNTSQEALGVILQDQWSQVGADVDFQPIDFNVLVEGFTAQTFDAVMIFWGFGFPADPDGVRVTFDPENDVVGSGFNAVSYNNPRVNELVTQARTLPGCDQAERTALYQEVYQILHDESPWIWLGSGETLAVAQGSVANFSPRPSLPTWNEDEWAIPRQ
ncbi:MAG: hypothetical protein H7Y11_03335 [Armatimonadetes bacterium]|nr:hypothetical protein [Anaerolineae bacterium]